MFRIPSIAKQAVRVMSGFPLYATSTVQKYDYYRTSYYRTPTVSLVEAPSHDLLRQIATTSLRRFVRLRIVQYSYVATDFFIADVRLLCTVI